MATAFYESHQGVKDAHVRIIEQPAPIVRFRYESEERNAGLLQGASSTTDTKSFPSIQIVGYKGRAAVLVSLVTAEEPYRPHPHSLVGKDCCSAGVCFLQIPPETMSIEFRNLKIQCVKKNQINDVLKRRKIRNIDPFKTGFSYPSPIDTTIVRLCFQVLLEGNEKGKFNVALPPVVSEPIVDKRTKPDLVIVELSDCVAYVDGDNKKIILLCEKISKDDDIEVRFYEEKNGKLVWEGFGDFQPSRVHKHVAISFHPPRYHDLEISDPVNVFVQMRRPSDGTTSESLPFQFKPALGRSRKRRKLSNLMNSSMQLGIENYSMPEYSKYEMNGVGDTTMGMEESLTLSREPDHQVVNLDAFSELCKQESTYHVAQVESINKPAQTTSQNTTSTIGQRRKSPTLKQSDFQNIPRTVEWTQINPQNNSLTLNGINQTSTQNTITTNTLQTVSSVVVNNNDPQSADSNRDIPHTAQEVNHLTANHIQNIPSNFNHVIQPGFINFQNTPSAINQIAQVILQNIPSIINQMTQSSIQNTSLSTRIDDKTGNQFLQTSFETKPTTNNGQSTSPIINLQDQSNLQNSPSNINPPIQFIFQNTPINNPQDVSSTMNPPFQVTTSHNTNIPNNSQLIDSQIWNIPLNLLKEGCEQSENSEKIEPTTLSAILEGIRNSEFQPVKLYSGELGSFDGISELNNLSDVLSNNLSLSDIDERPDQNMSDSLTKLINSTADNICQETNKFW